MGWFEMGQGTIETKARNFQDWMHLPLHGWGFKPGSSGARLWVYWV